MKNIHEITIINEATYEAIGELCNGNCEPIANDEGLVFTSIIDAAKHAGVLPQNMWRHLNEKKVKPIKGHVYFYAKKNGKSFGRVMKCLSDMSADAERYKADAEQRKADAEDARKWREYQAEMEAKRIAEEKRLEAERKAKEKLNELITKAEERVARRTAIYDRLVSQLAKAEQRKMQAEIELEALLDRKEEM